MRKQVVAALDPGLEAGLCVWTKGERLERFATRSIAVPARELSAMKSRVPVQKQWERHMWLQAEQLRVALPAQLQRVFIERPDFVKGDTVKLCVLIGVLAQVCADVVGEEVHFIGVNEWKGQLSKGLCDKRVARILSMTTFQLKKKSPTDHERDAVGLMLYLEGYDICRS